MRRASAVRPTSERGCSNTWASGSLWPPRCRESSKAASLPQDAVAQVRVLPDAMRVTVLLTIADPSGEQMTLELPPHVAKYIADEVPGILREMGTRRQSTDFCALVRQVLTK